MAEEMYAELFGLSDQHLANVPPDAKGQPAVLHQDVIGPFLSLQQAAQQAGYQLAIASGFRSFERQMMIWNAKASGQRPVLDCDGKPLDLRCLPPKEQVFAILRWSALPGGSRHHWGTDMDVWDPSSVAADYQLQLVPEECEQAGPFAGLHQWLDRQIAADDTGFYRPYASDRGGVAPERWHLSYRPIAERFESQLSASVLAAQIANTELALKETVLDNLDEIFERFIRVW